MTAKGDDNFLSQSYDNYNLRELRPTEIKADKIFTDKTILGIEPLQYLESKINNSLKFT